VLAGLALLDEELSALRQAARERPKLRLPNTVTTQQPPFYPNTSPADIRNRVREINRVLALRTAAQLADGPAKLDDLMLGFRLAKGIDELPHSTMHYVESVLDLTQAVYDGITAQRWTKDQLLQIQKQYAALDFWTSLESFRVQYIRQLIADDERVIEGRTGKGRGRESIIARQFPIGTIREHQAIVLGWGVTNLPKLIDIKARRLDPAIVNDAQANRPDVAKTGYYDQFRMNVRAVAFAQTTANQVVLACAIERYRLDNQRRLPNTLDELTPQYVSEIPNDVMTARPLIFKPRSEGAHYLLYSVGVDGQDNGGLGGNIANSWGFHQLLQGTDWVWNSDALTPAKPAKKK